jgi:acyl carrier protein
MRLGAVVIIAHKTPNTLSLFQSLSGLTRGGLHGGDSMKSAAEADDLIRSAIALACQRGGLPIADNTGVMDLGLDSVAFIGIVSSLEAEKGSDLSEEQLVALYQASTVGDIIALAKAILS